MVLSILTFLAVVTAVTALIVGILSFLVNRDFFLPFTLNAVQGLGVSQGRIVMAICLLVEIVVTLYLIYNGFHYVNYLLTSPSPSPAAVNSFNPADMVRNLGGVAIAVVIVLLIMSVYSIAIIVERYITYRAAVNSLQGEAKDHQVKSDQKSFADRGDIVHGSKSALETDIASKTSSFKRGLSGLATVGSTAPFVGLFGTVFGIINAFRGMDKAESGGIAAVAGGVSEALFTTALGLLVAVPAIWLFNYFTEQIDDLGEKMSVLHAEDQPQHDAAELTASE